MRLLGKGAGMPDLISVSEISGMIIEFRGHKVILDSDLSMLYQVSTKRLMEQVRRNVERFPADFMFCLTKNEWRILRSQFATFGKKVPPKKYPPYVFTRNGANMVSAILKSPIAINRSIQIMRAFTVLEEIMGQKKQILSDSPTVMDKLSTHSRAIMHLFQKDKVKANEIAKVKKIINEMISVLRQMVLK
jgi:hypothetical protein